MLGKLFVFALACMICVISASPTPTIKDIKDLSDRLMVNYSKHILPSNTHNYDNPFNITIYVGLEAIGGIDEIEEKLSTVLRIIYEWTDDSIHWDLADTNVPYITLGWSDVWKPVLRVTNPQTDSSQAQYCDRSYETVFFDQNGWAYFDELVTTRTTCDMDMSYYPFDVQTCEIKMTMIESSKFWFNISIEVFKDFEPSDIAEHGSWDFKSMTSSAEMGTFVIKLVLKRRPLFLLLNIVLPLYILALLTPVVFLLPKKSGERVGYSVAMLLAISVYMTIVSEHLPHNSNPAPLLPVMVFTWYIFDAVVVLVVIVNTKINLTTPNTPVPSTCSAFVRLTRKIVCQGSPKVTEKCSVDEKENCIGVENVDNDKDGSEGMYSASFEEENEEDVNVTWQELSHAIDKWCFVISYIVKFFMPVIFLIVMKVKSQA